MESGFKVSNPKPTFRDPAGSVQFQEGQVIRTIHPHARVEVVEWLGSSLCKTLEQRGDLVESTIDETGGLRLLHPRLKTVTYPWEWTPSQWLAAAELTLRLCAEGVEQGWVLKDATPLNILFVGPRPVLVDVLSFERRDPASSTWLAYGQYMRTFLLPLVMHRLASWPLELTLFRRDGYEPADLYAALGWGKRLSGLAFWPITLPALMEKRNGAGPAKAAAPSRDPGLAKHILLKTIDGLRKRTRRTVQGKSSEWAEYTSSLSHYTAEQTADKHAWVKAAIESCSPAHVLDIGANTGEYSELAASIGAQVVSLERDEPAADRLFQRASKGGMPIQTIHADLARPTPAVGWENSESTSLLARLHGEFDLVMMLAVIHHLILMEQIPVADILSLCQNLTRRWLIVEWVPVSDPMFQSLMRGRDALYGGLSESDLLTACSGRFALADRHLLGNGRVLFLLERVEAA